MATATAETEVTTEQSAVTGGVATQVAEPAYGHNAWWPRGQGPAWEPNQAGNPWNSYRGPTDNYAGYGDPAGRPWEQGYRPEWQPTWQPPPRQIREEDCLDKDKDPCPKWEGDHPETSLKPWLREIKRWYNHTIVAPRRRGQKLIRALPMNSMAYRAANLLSDEDIDSANGFDLIVEEIKNTYSWIFEIEPQITLIDVIFGDARHPRQLFTEFIAERRFMVRAFETAFKTTFPSMFWGIMLWYKSNMSERETKNNTKSLSKGRAN